MLARRCPTKMQFVSFSDDPSRLDSSSHQRRLSCSPVHRARFSPPIESLYLLAQIGEGLASLLTRSGTGQGGRRINPLRGEALPESKHHHIVNSL